MTEPSDDHPLNIKQVIVALINTGSHSRINLDGDPDLLKRSSISGDDALIIVERELAGYKMSHDTYESVLQGARKAPAHVKERFVAALETWRSAAWPSLRGDLLARAVEGFGDYRFTGPALRSRLEIWPELRREPDLIKAALSKVRIATGRDLTEALENLAALDGGVDEARAALAVVAAARPHRQEDRITGLLDSWAGATVWGQLMACLWSPVPEERQVPAAVTSLACLLRQVPLVTGPSLDGFVLGEMSGASRAAWRQSLVEACGDDLELRKAATEALLWFADAQEDLFAQFTALEINDPDPLAALEPLLSHPSRLVCLRTQSALALLAGTPDPLETLITREPVTETGRPAPGVSRTWLGDARLEQLLRTAFGEAASSMAAEVPLTASSGEENLVGKLFERLRAACDRVTEQAAILARETDRGERLTVALTHRVIGKVEEGEPGLVATGRFSTDVTLILRARRGAEPPFSQRASFVQAKRLRRGKPPEGEHYAVSLSQMRDIAEQSSSSFLLAVGPEAAGVTMPVVPAQLLLDRYGAVVKEKHLHPDAVSRLGRNLAGWLVDDVIGLWTGDPRIEAVAKAAAGAGDCDTILVEIEVAMVPVDPESEDRKPR